MSYIEINNLTKDYGNGRGLFDISLKVNKGETVGIVGINSAGKTTLLRHLMGFLKQQSGTCAINGLDCWADSEQIKNLVCYIPGEINFPPLKYGDDFLKAQADFWGVKDLTSAKALAKKLQLDTSALLKRMSKGMKQKTAITASFIPDADILIFDEPTTGLDPLMRNVFLEVIALAKSNGKTIIMSSHMFEEVEECCDRIVLLKEGHIISEVGMDDIRHSKDKKYKIEFANETDYKKFQTDKFKIIEERPKYNQLILQVNDADINEFFKRLTLYDIKFISEIKTTLEEFFLKEYKNENNK